MSRQHRYLALYPFYQEENERYEALNKRAAAYLTVIAGFAFIAFFKVDAIVAIVLSSRWIILLLLAAGILSVAAVVLVALSLRIENYRSLVDLEQLVLDSDQQSYTPEDVYTVMLGGLVESTSINRAINNRRAGRLQVALWFALSAAGAVIVANIGLFFVIQQR